MYRFELETYLEDNLIFSMEFRSITSVARCIDRFINTKGLKILFYVHDNVKCRDINVDELMKIWHQ